MELRNIQFTDDPTNYLPSNELIDAIEIAYALKRPLLLTGEPGTGKTQFAYWVAHELSKRQNFQPQPYIFNTKTSSTAQDLFYHYDAISHFRDNSIHNRDMKTGEGAEDFIQLRALGLAILNAIGEENPLKGSSIIRRSNLNLDGKGSVVLIDEIDKAPRDFPNDLLNEIENYEFEIKEINKKIRLNDTAQKEKILVILTSNFEKNLPDAFLRRCIFYHIGFPSKAKLAEIIRRKLPLNDISVSQFVENRVDDFFVLYNYPNIIKKPSTSEFVDWMKVLLMDNALSKQFFLNGHLNNDTSLLKYLPVLLKNKDDIKTVAAAGTIL